MARASLLIQFIFVILLGPVWMSGTQVLEWKWERKDTLISDAHSSEAENVLFVGVSLQALEDLYKAKFRSHYNVTFVNCEHLDTKENSFSFNCQVLYTMKSTDLTREKRQNNDLGLNLDFSDFDSVLVQGITDLSNKAKNNLPVFRDILNKAILNNEINGTFVSEGPANKFPNSTLDELHKEYNQSKLDGPVNVTITSTNATISVINPILHPVESSATSTTDSSTIPFAKETSFSPSTEQTSMPTSTVDNITFPGRNEVSTGPSAGETNKSTRESTTSITSTSKFSSGTTLIDRRVNCSTEQVVRNAECRITNGSCSCTCMWGFSGNGTHCDVAKIYQMERDSTLSVEGLTTPLTKALFIGASIIQMENYYKRIIEQTFTVVSTSCKHISIAGNDYTFKCLAYYMPKNSQIAINRMRRQLHEPFNLTNMEQEIGVMIKDVMILAKTNSTIYEQLMVQYISGTTVNTQAELRVTQQYSQLFNDEFNAMHLNITVNSDKPIYRDMEQLKPIQTTPVCEPGYGGDECDELEINSPLVIGLISVASLLLLIVLGLSICRWRRCAVSEDKADFNQVSDTERMDQPIAYTNLHFLPDSYVKIPRPRYVPGVVKPTFEVEDDLY